MIPAPAILRQLYTVHDAMEESLRTLCRLTNEGGGDDVVTLMGNLWGDHDQLERMIVKLEASLPPATVAELHAE